MLDVFQFEVVEGEKLQIYMDKLKEEDTAVEGEQEQGEAMETGATEGQTETAPMES